MTALHELVQTEDFATKQDVFTAKMELEQKISQMQYTLLKWQIGIGFALVMIMAKGFGWLGF